MSTRHGVGMGRLVEIAVHQHGLVTRLQARSVGIDRNMLRRMVRRGELEPVGHGVFRVLGHPPGPYAGAMAAVLDAGANAVVSHATAAHLWGVPNMQRGRCHVTIPRLDGIRHDHLAIIHQATKLPEDLVAHVEGVPVVAPALVVLQVAGSLPSRAVHVLDTLWAKRLVSITEVEAVHQRYRRQGQRGIVLVRRLLEDRSDDMRPAESGNERRFEWIMIEGGIRTLQRQVDVGAASWVGRVDFRDSDLPLVVEIHSERYHASRSARDKDAARTAALETAGFVVVVVWEHEIWADPSSVLTRVHEARRRLMAA